MFKGLIKALAKTEDLSNTETFLKALPIIGICLLGIFGVTAFIILTVRLLNKFSTWLEERKNNNGAE